MTRPSPPAEVCGSVVRVEYLVSAGDWCRDDESLLPEPSLPFRPASGGAEKFPRRVLVRDMINRIEKRMGREILTSYLWTLHEC